MSFDLGINFRATSSFVTDSTNETYSLGETYAVSRGGTTFGWTASRVGSARDRSATNDRRLAGMVFAVAGGTGTFRLNLPSAGSYVVHLAMGDPLYNGGDGTWQIDLLDSNGTSVLFSVASPQLAQNSFYDAMGVGYTAASWPGSEQGRAVTVSGTVIFARIGWAGGSTGFTPLAHLRVVSAGGPAAPIFRRTLYRRAGSRGVMYL